MHAHTVSQNNDNNSNNNNKPVKEISNIEAIMWSWRQGEMHFESW